jgi:hypothetical protein
MTSDHNDDLIVLLRDGGVYLIGVFSSNGEFLREVHLNLGGQRTQPIRPHMKLYLDLFSVIFVDKNGDVGWLSNAGASAKFMIFGCDGELKHEQEIQLKDEPRLNQIGRGCIDHLGNLIITYSYDRLLHQNYLFSGLVILG